jgi:hypothetical protein
LRLTPATVNGSQALEVTTTNAAIDYAYQDITVTASTRYRLTAWLRNVDAVSASISVYDNTNAAYVQQSVRRTTGTSYRFVTIDFTTPVACVSAQIRLEVEGTGAPPDDTHFDDIVVRKLDYGTAVTPSLGIPVNDFTETSPYEVILDEALRGIAAKDFKSIQGAGHSEFSFEGFAYPEELGYLLRLIMGSNGTIYNGTIYTHNFILHAFPESLTLEADVVGSTNGGQRITGARLSQLAFNFGSEGVLTYNAEGMGKIASKVTATNPAATDNTPWANWRGTVTSSGITNRLVSATLTIARPLQVVHTNRNSQELYELIVGPMEVSGSMVVTAESLVDFDNFLAHLNQSFVIAFTQGSGATEKTLTFTMTALSFADGPMEIDRGDQGVLFNLPIRAIYNATDLSPLIISLVNARASYAT